MKSTKEKKKEEVKIYTKDNIVGCVFVTSRTPSRGDTKYTVARIDGRYNVRLEYRSDRSKTSTTYNMSTLLKYVNTGYWCVITQSEAVTASLTPKPKVVNSYEIY